MKIALVYTERASLSLDRPFSYYVNPNDNVLKGTRVNINFNGSDIVGYVEDVIESSLTREEYENENGFELKDIASVLDKEPLLNEELNQLVHYMAKETISPLISCYQAILPPSLKPTSAKKTDIRTMKAIHFNGVNEEEKLTKKDLEFIELIKNNDLFVSEINGYTSNIKRLKDKGIITVFDKEFYRSPLTRNYEHIDDYKLTNDQQSVINEINSSSDNFYLLEGITASGKTEVYINLARQVIRDGKNVLVLIPEISLTPQMIERFKERFDCDIAIFHSKLSNGEKYDEYRRIRNGEVRIVVGARSACFAPLENIGLIIVDEEHSNSYKQDNTPAYNMINIVEERSKYHNCKVILGSATPSIESKTKALKGIYHQLYLNKRINNNPLPDVEIVDMKEEIKQRNYSMFSRLLKQKINETLDANHQVILLLNRRGYSLNIQCSNCGYTFKCPNCDIPLHYHKNDNKLKCHYCGYQIKKTENCPVCGSKYLRYLGSGSQKLEEELTKEFKQAKPIRLDLDSTSRKGSLEKSLNDFKNGKYNVMLGTQIIAKGLDFPNVDLVGIINADSSLYFSDFREGEKAYQLFAQVAGRCGRGDKKGLAIIQTVSPTNKSIVAASKQDYESFYAQEMAFRKEMQYPPYCKICSFIISGSNKDNLYKYAMYIKEELEVYKKEDVTILGPSEPLLSTQFNKFKYRFILKYKNKEETFKLLNYIKDLVNSTSYQIKFYTDPYQNL